MVKDVLFLNHSDNTEEVYKKSSSTEQDWYDSMIESNLLSEEYAVATDGTQLHALSLRSPSPSKIVIITLHGFSREALHQLLNYGRFFQQNLGYNVFAPDLRNSGDSGGSVTGWGVLDKEDMLLWVNRVNELYGKNCFIVLHGLSMGASTVLQVLADEQLPSNVICGIADASYSSFEDVIAYQINLHLKNIIQRDSFIKKFRQRLLAENDFDIEKASAIQHIANIRQPVLFIHSEFDKVAPIWMMYEMYLAKPEPKDYWVVSLSNHSSIFEDHTQEYLTRVEQFVRFWTE